MRARLMIAAAGAVWLGSCARPVVYQGYSTATRRGAVALIRPSDGNDIGEIDGRSIPGDTALGTAVVEVLPGEHAFMVRMRRTLNKQGSFFSISGHGAVEAKRCYQPLVECPNVRKDCRAALAPADCPSTWFARREEVVAPRYDSDSSPECRQDRGPPPLPETQESCVAPDDAEDDGPPSCVPAPSRGPQIAHDRALGVRVFRACERTVAHGQRGPAHLDRRRLIVERTGERSMIYEDFDDVVRDARSLPIPGGDVRRFTQGECPGTGGPDRAGEHCIFVDLATNAVDLPALMRAFAQLYAGVHAVCIPVVVELGDPAPCPEHLGLEQGARATPPGGWQSICIVGKDDARAREPDSSLADARGLLPVFRSARTGPDPPGSSTYRGGTAGLGGQDDAGRASDHEVRPARGPGHHVVERCPAAERLVHTSAGELTQLTAQSARRRVLLPLF